MRETPLQLVDDAYVTQRNVYVVGTDVTEFISCCDRMEVDGWYVLNVNEDRLVDDGDLAAQLCSLTRANAVVLPDDWWTSTRCHQLVLIAGFLHLPLLNYGAEQIETA